MWVAFLLGSHIRLADDSDSDSDISFDYPDFDRDLDSNDGNDGLDLITLSCQGE